MLFPNGGGGREWADAQEAAIPPPPPSAPSSREGGVGEGGSQLAARQLRSEKRLIQFKEGLIFEQAAALPLGNWEIPPGLFAQVRRSLLRAPRAGH